MTTDTYAAFIQECCTKAREVLIATPGKVYTTTALARACGYSGQSFDVECNRFVKALHKGKTVKSYALGYWRQSATRTSRFKDAESGQRHPSIEWVYDPTNPPPAAVAPSVQPTGAIQTSADLTTLTDEALEALATTEINRDPNSALSDRIADEQIRRERLAQDVQSAIDDSDW